MSLVMFASYSEIIRYGYFVDFRLVKLARLYVFDSNPGEL